jgi:hypothetical protein
LIAIDRATVWALGHSFSKLAKCTHMSLVRIPPEAAARMIAAYADVGHRGAAVAFAAA